MGITRKKSDNCNPNSTRTRPKPDFCYPTSSLTIVRSFFLVRWTSGSGGIWIRRLPVGGSIFRIFRIFRVFISISSIIVGWFSIILFVIDFHFFDRFNRTFFSNLTLGTQSFTSLKADLCQDVNGGFAFSRCIKWNISLKEVLH